MFGKGIQEAGGAYAGTLNKRGREGERERGRRGEWERWCEKIEIAKNEKDSFNGE